jgi:hypothetical protein
MKAGLVILTLIPAISIPLQSQQGTCIANAKPTIVGDVACACTGRLVPRYNCEGPETGKNCLVTSASCGSSNGHSCSALKTIEGCQVSNPYASNKSSTRDKPSTAIGHLSLAIPTDYKQSILSSKNDCSERQAIFEAWLANQIKAQDNAKAGTGILARLERTQANQLQPKNSRVIAR